MEKTTYCKVCLSESVLFDVVDFNKCCSDTDWYQHGLLGIPVYYFRCLKCNFIFTSDFDHWNQSEFSSEIYNSDYIKYDPEYLSIRPSRIAEYFTEKLSSLDDNLALLDFGSGSGVFADNLLNDKITSRSYDPFSSPDKPVGTYDIVTCFEVVEHSADPEGVFLEIFSFMKDDGVLVFSTAIQPLDILRTRANWWYIGPRNGHISIYSDDAIDFIAKKHGFNYFKGSGYLCFCRSQTLPDFLNGFGFHLFFSVKLGVQYSITRTWHEREFFPNCNDYGQWSSDSTLVWRFRDLPCGCKLILKLVVPILNKITDTFASSVVLSVNGKIHTFSYVKGDLSFLLADMPIELDNADLFIKIVTPDPLVPASIGLNNDMRRLGICLFSSTGTNLLV